jgi:hypothetical protein
MAGATLALGLALLVLGLAAWGARLGWFVAPSWVPAAWLLAVVLVLLAFARSRRRGDAYSSASVAHWLERAGGWRLGSLTALLDAPARGTSDSLLGLADGARAEELRRNGAAALGPVVRPLESRLMRSVGVLLMGGVLLGSAQPWRGPGFALWSPARALRDAAKPVRLSASADAVDRGGAVRLRIEAPGRRDAMLWTRATGEAWTPVSIRLDSLGVAERDFADLRADLHARATSAGRSSDTLHVRVRLPAFLGSLLVTARYPAYLGLQDEPIPTTGDTILLPAGTRLDTRGEATTTLVAAQWRREADAESLTVDGSGFHGSFRPIASGVYLLQLMTASGAPLGGDPVQLPVRLVPDSAPAIDLPVPGADTVAPLSMRLPLVVDARDDYGLSAVYLEARRNSTAAATRIPIALDGRPEHAILGHELALAGFRLSPGDTLRYRAIAVDNSPGAQIGRSREYLLRLPTEADLRDARREAIVEISRRLDSLSGRSAEVARTTEDLSREQPRTSNNTEGKSDASLSFEQAQRAEAAAQATEQLMHEAEQLRDAVRQLEEAVERAGLDDPAFRQRLEEVRQQLEQALTPELREKLAELQRALRELDAQGARQSLEELARAQEQLRDALERSRELFERAALEGEMTALAEEAKQLAEEQAQWNAEAASADSGAAAAREGALAERADSLAADLREASAQDAAEAAQSELSQAAEQASQAAQKMQEASAQMRAGNRQGAAQSGKQAEQLLQPLGAQLEAARDGMQDEWREEVLAALDLALAETSRLTQRQLQLGREFTGGATTADTRATQGAVEDGVTRVLAQMQETAGRNALVSSRILPALAIAQQEMGRAREALASAVPDNRTATAHAGGAVDALTLAAYYMVRSRDDVAGSGSGSGMQEAMQRMSQLAGQQGQAGQQAASLLPMAGAGQGRIGQQLAQAAAAQRAVAEQLERLRAQGGMPAAGALAEEARALARELESARLSQQTVERQQRLFRRMLDAGRTLEGEERDEQKERESTSAKPGEILLPPALRDRLLRDGDRPRLPDWDELQRLSPAERRLVVEYFRVLAEPATR